jgi:hypothetical protein
LKKKEEYELKRKEKKKVMLFANSYCSPYSQSNITMQIDGTADPLELFLGFYSQPSDLHDAFTSERVTLTLALLEKATPLPMPTIFDKEYARYLSKKMHKEKGKEGGGAI